MTCTGFNEADQSGKSTLAQLVAATQHQVRSLTLDDPVALRAAHDDPVGFIEHDGLLVIDEVQRAPELFLPIKADVDADPRPGRFLLAGSAQVLALKSLPDALPGRMETIELWPFSQGEIAGAPDRFIDAAFANGVRLTQDSDLRRRDYLERAAVGGFPEAVRRTDRRRAAFFESYIDTLIKRDVQEISAIERTPQLRKLLQLLAIRSANLLVAATLANELAIHRSTITRYLALLETVFLIKTIPAWSGGATHRAIGTPKLAFVDTGVLVGDFRAEQAGRTLAEVTPKSLLTILWWGYHNHMALKKTTVMVDENDLKLIKQAAAREGRPESEFFREAFHLAAIKSRRWQESWDIPVVDLGRPITDEEIRQTVSDAVVGDEAGDQ